MSKLANNEPELDGILLDSIKNIARSYKGHSLTLQTTEIVHEGYLQLINEGSKKWSDKNTYLAAFAVTMRRFLIDRYRKKIATKRGGKDHLFSIEDLNLEFPVPDGFSDWLDLDRKLTQLNKVDPLLAQVVQLKFFVGLSTQEIAEVINKDPRTVSRKWHFARAWLHSKLAE